MFIINFIKIMSGSTVCYTIPPTQSYCYEIIDNVEANLKETMDPIIQTSMPLVNNYRRDPSMKIPVISIAGCSGVGKSYFSQK